MFALLCLFLTAVFVCITVSEYENDFMPGVFIYGLLAVASFFLFLAEIQS